MNAKLLPCVGLSMIAMGMVIGCDESTKPQPENQMGQLPAYSTPDAVDLPPQIEVNNEALNELKTTKP
jgi:hypothetical protein